MAEHDPAGMWPPQGSEMAEVIRHADWEKTPLGPIRDWPASLRVTVSTVLDSPLPSIVLWGPTLIQLYNDAYREILARRHPQAMGQETYACWPEIRAFNEPIYRRVLEHGERVLFEDQEYWIAPSGVPEQRYFTITYGPARDESGAVRGVCVVAMETTRRLLAERQQSFLLQLSDRLRMLSPAEDVACAACEQLGKFLDVARVVFCEVEIDADTFLVRSEWRRDGLASVTGLVRRLTEFGPDNVASLQAGKVFACDDTRSDPRTAAHAAAYANLDVVATLAIPLIRNGKLTIILNLHQVTPHHWTPEDILLARDMAERTWSAAESARAQAELRTERDHSQYILENMSEGFGMLDEQWRVLQMNAEGLRLGKRSAADVIGKNHWEVWPGTRGTTAETVYQRVRETGKAETFEQDVSLSAAASTWMEVRVNRSLDGTLSIFYHDISSRKAVEQTLHEAARQKDEFLAMLAHELRNPLAPICTAAKLLSIGDLDQAQVRQISGVIARQAAHMTRLIEDLLDVSRVTRGYVTLNKVALDVKSIVMDAIDQARPQLEARHHHFEVQLSPDPTWVTGDKERLVQVLANLLGNAARYTPNGGQIIFSLDTTDSEVVLSVVDNGIGMSPALIERVFDLFSQAERTVDRVQGGLGIGLALVRSLVELHDGTVTAASHGISQGSRFTVRLPRLQPVGGAAAGLVFPETMVTCDRPLRVLVVDDNVDAAAMLAMFLQAEGHEVVVENASRAALVRAHAAPVDVCLLDLGLPEIDGNELARQLRLIPQMHEAVLVAVTGYDQVQDRERAFAAGFDHHFAKPVDSARLTALLAVISAAR